MFGIATHTNVLVFFCKRIVTLVLVMLYICLVALVILDMHKGLKEYSKKWLVIDEVLIVLCYRFSSKPNFSQAQIF